MSDLRVKLCPNCQTQNAPRELNCVNCGQDIEREPAVDLIAGSTAENAPSPATKAAPVPSTPVAAQAAPSPGAGTPIAELHAADGTALRWTAVDGARIGRGRGTLDMTPLLGGDTVSGHHATLRWLSGAWWLEACRSTNPTEVNGIVVANGDRVKLADGDVITVGEVSLIFLPAAASQRSE